MNYQKTLSHSAAMRAKYHALSHKRAADSSPPFVHGSMGKRLRVPIGNNRRKFAEDILLVPLGIPIGVHPNDPNELQSDAGQNDCRQDSA